MKRLIMILCFVGLLAGCSSDTNLEVLTSELEKQDLPQLTKRMILATAERKHSQSRSMGTCGRCSRPWSFAKEHGTFFNETSGMFPLCEDCWQELTPETRLPYYQILWQQWKAQSPEYPRQTGEWQQIEKAVLGGK